MKHLQLPVLLAGILISGIVAADSYAPRATSLDELIDNADIIVKGQLTIVGSKEFYGYNPDGSDATRDEFAEQTGLPDHLLDEFGFLLVEYLVNPTEIIKGDVGELIVLRVMITQITDHLSRTLDRERLFMLTRTHAGADTYGTMSFDAIMERDSQNSYRVASIGSSQDSVVLEQPTTYLSADDLVVDVFDNLVRERVNSRD